MHSEVTDREAAGQALQVAYSNRLFPRVRCALPVGFELVTWDDHDETQLKKPQWITSHDLSASGIGFVVPVSFSRSERKKLDSGLLKLRLAIRLVTEADPVITFARLVWGDVQATRHGFSFIDIPEPGFRRLRHFVDQNLTRDSALTAPVV